MPRQMAPEGRQDGALKRAYNALMSAAGPATATALVSALVVSSSGLARAPGVGELAAAWRAAPREMAQMRAPPRSACSMRASCAAACCAPLRPAHTWLQPCGYRPCRMRCRGGGGAPPAVRRQPAALNHRGRVPPFTATHDALHNTQPSRRRPLTHNTHTPLHSCACASCTPPASCSRSSTACSLLSWRCPSHTTHTPKHTAARA